MTHAARGVGSAATQFKPKHGMSNCDAHGRRDPTYTAWRTMNQRCSYPNHKSYKYYGGRGITVCDRWRSFELFLSDMGRKPDGMTLDRIDTNGSYEPANCRWATHKQQARNRRSSVVIGAFGESLTAVEWAEKAGIRADTLLYRIRVRGMSPEDAISTPVERRA